MGSQFANAWPLVAAIAPLWPEKKWGGTSWFWSYDIVIADKKANSEGLQFVDLVARPIGLSIVYPNQSNRALKILEKKFHKSSERVNAERDFIVYP